MGDRERDVHRGEDRPWAGAHVSPQGTSLLVRYLILLLTMASERLYRLRWLHRGTHPVRSASALVRTLRLSLGRPFRDTS
jgi:hypothetical protein